MHNRWYLDSKSRCIRSSNFIPCDYSGTQKKLLPLTRFHCISFSRLSQQETQSARLNSMQTTTKDVDEDDDEKFNVKKLDTALDASLHGLSRVNNLRSRETRLERQTVTIYCATFNVGNQPINETFYTEFLKKSEDCDVVVVAAQEASYGYSRKITQPADFARLAEKKVENDSIVNKKEKKTFWGSSKATKMVATLSGGITGGVATGPLAPIGFVVGMVGGYYGGKKIAEESKCKQHWFASVEACLKSKNTRSSNKSSEYKKNEDGENDDESEYVLVQSEVLMQMRLSVHCKKYLEKNVKSVRVGVKATGMGNVVGNKGGIMVEIQFYGGESIAFIGCHLAAHEEKKFYTRRIETIRSILGCAWRDRIEKAFGCEGNGQSWEHSIKAVAEASGLMSGDKNSNNKSSNISSNIDNARREVDEEEQKKRRRLPPDLELLESATHTFFMGDLNFRIDPGPTQAHETVQINSASEMVGADDDDENSVWNSCWSKADIVKETSVNRRAKLPGEIESGDEDSESDSQVNTRKQRENVSTGGTSQSSPFHVGWKFIVETIKQKSWGRLWIGDQLLHAQRQGKCLFGFQELPLQFPPSFKREKGRNDSNPIDATEEYYSKKRIPSYTDRVLIKSLPGFEATRKAHKYEACHGVTSSDHAPVCATFSVNLLLGTSEHEDANDEVLSARQKDDDEYFAILTVEKLQLETHDDRLIFATEEEQSASLLKVHLGKLRTNALEVDDFETAEGSRWSNAKSISNVVLLPSRSFAKDEGEDEEENIRVRSRSSCVWNSRTLRRIGNDALNPDVLPVVKLPKKRAELQNAPYYVIFTVVNENTNARVGTAIISVPTDGKRLPFEADCTSRGRVVGKLRGEWAIDLKVT